MGSPATAEDLLAGSRPVEEILLSESRAAGAGFHHIVFTRNRRVMVSLGDRGRALRLHELFREAPAEVVAAVARLYGRGPGPERAAARQTVREFIRTGAAALGLDARSRPVRPRRPEPGDADRIALLRTEFDRVNREHFAGALPAVTIALSGRMRRRNGHFSTAPLEIVISRRLFTGAAAGEAEHTLRHEMIHLWQHVNRGTLGHGADFRRWAERLGVHPRAVRAVRPPG